MKKIASSLFSSSNVRRLVPFLWILVSLLATWLSGRLLFTSSLMSSFSSTIIDIGLDPLRTQLVAALVMTALSALLGTAVGRRKLGAMIGGAAVFLSRYLLGFIRLEQQPLLDPEGRLEPLNSSALLHTSIVMVALALLSAFLGAAIGRALGEVLLDPPFQVIHLVWLFYRNTRRRKKDAEGTVPMAPAPSSRLLEAIQMTSKWLAAGVMLALLSLAVNASDLFVFSPDIGLHTTPKLHSAHAMPVHGTIVQDSLVSMALMGQKRFFQVYLPPSYNAPSEGKRSYPTLYLLHGSPGRYTDWIIGGKAGDSADTLITLGKIPELIMIAPDGGGQPGATSEWGNSFDQHQLIENYVANDLVKYVDTHYRTIPDAAHRAIGGLSMGGFGAMNIAMHHPNVFGKVISLGGYYYAEGSIWGKSNLYRQQNSPATLLQRSKESRKLQMYIGAATKDQPYFNDAKQFTQELTTFHVPYTLDVQIGYHSWRIWQVQMYNALLWLKWGQPAPSPKELALPRHIQARPRFSRAFE